MAVIDQDIVENVGLIKEFDQESTEMLMQVVQKDLYTKPIESSIRETFSNCFDAIKEKKIALSILRGDTIVEDHYVSVEGSSNKSSKFNPSYYHAKYLDEHNNQVLIEYIEKSSERDIIAISDKGVGLANGRLEGYFSPGYSSKRLAKDLLGKYGYKVIKNPRPSLSEMRGSQLLGELLERYGYPNLWKTMPISSGAI